MLRSPEFSHNAILSRFGIEYQSPVASLFDDLAPYRAAGVAPSLRGDDLLSPTPALFAALSALTGHPVLDTESYLRAVGERLDAFRAAGCAFADHALDADFFERDTDGARAAMLCRLGQEYKRRGFTLLLHVDAMRKPGTRLARVAGPAGGYAAAGESFDISAVAELLGKMEANGGLPDTVLFPLNMSDQAPFAVLHGSYSEDGVASKVQLGPAWWWCDHAFGIRNTLESIASFGVLSQFIGMTTDSRSILSFVRHDYFRRLLCSWLDEKNNAGEWELSEKTLSEIVQKISYSNTKLKIIK
jgi:glucuronate isomerase